MRLSNYKKAIDGLQQLWPEVVTEDPLLVKDGGREAFELVNPPTKTLLDFQWLFVLIDIVGFTCV